MFRLIKLGIYVMLGYFIYEMYAGMTSAPTGGKQRGQGQGQRGRGQSARGASSGSGTTMTGKGRGRRVQSEDADGATESHVVGRGVV